MNQAVSGIREPECSPTTTLRDCSGEPRRETARQGEGFEGMQRIRPVDRVEAISNGRGEPQCPATASSNSATRAAAAHTMLVICNDGADGSALHPEGRTPGWVGGKAKGAERLRSRWSATSRTVRPLWASAFRCRQRLRRHAALRQVGWLPSEDPVRVPSRTHRPGCDNRPRPHKPQPGHPVRESNSADADRESWHVPP